MSTLTAPSQFANVLTSYNDLFIKPQIEVAMSIAVYYQGGGRLNTSSALPPHHAWAEVNIRELSPQTATMVTGAGQHGVIMQYLASINYFVKTDAIMNGTITIYAAHKTLDQIQALFRPKAGTVLIYDYDTVGTPQVGALQPVGFPSCTEIVVPTELGIQQWNISSTLQQVKESID